MASLLLLLAASFGAVAALRLLARWTAVSMSPFDVEPWLSGHRPTEHALSRYHARWYTASVVFLAFDVEMLFMYPWAVVVGRSRAGRRGGDVRLLADAVACRRVGTPRGGVPVGLIDVLARVAGSRGHVLVAEAPGAFASGLPSSALWTGWAGASRSRWPTPMSWPLSVSQATALAAVVDARLVAAVRATGAAPGAERDRGEVRLGQAREQLGGSGRRLTGPDVRRGFTPAVDAMAHDHDHDAHR